jgi:hypothetical protein
VSGRRGFALGSVLVLAALIVGVAIGRSTKRESGSDEEPSLASSRFTDELTDTVPSAAAPAPEPEILPVEVTAPRPAPAAPIVSPAPRPLPAPARAAAPDAGAVAPPEPAPVAEPAPPPAATPAAVPAPPPPDPYLVRQGRAFDDGQITSSSWDEEDVSEYSVVPDREVTRSSFDDQDKVDDHPTGR